MMKKVEVVFYNNNNFIAIIEYCIISKVKTSTLISKLLIGVNCILIKVRRGYSIETNNFMDNISVASSIMIGLLLLH